MIREIGSIFSLDYTFYKESDLSVSPMETDGRYNYSLCREALYDIASAYDATSKRVMIPAYTCGTVITPFTEQGWKCLYYPVDRRLRIPVKNVLVLAENFRPDIFIVHPYCGMDLDADELEFIEVMRKRGCRIVVDITQCIFSSQYDTVADYVVGSYRKWLPMPDGAFLYFAHGDRLEVHNYSENKEFVNFQKEAMYLRHCYFRTGDVELKKISIHLNKWVSGSVEKNTYPHKMSDLSYTVYLDADMEKNQASRIKNYRFLYEHLSGNMIVSPVCCDIKDVTTAPLYFPLYSSNREYLQRKLAEDGIYAPVLWPLHDKALLINDDIEHIYSRILMLPIDQRYGLDDMSFIVNKIENNV